MNEARLFAVIVERQALRYTPAGVPVTDLRIAHESRVVEAGATRKITFEMSAIALGEWALQTQAAPLETPLWLYGFLAPRSKQSKTLVLHVTGLETRENDHAFAKILKG